MGLTIYFWALYSSPLGYVSIFMKYHTSCMYVDFIFLTFSFLFLFLKILFIYLAVMGLC